MFSVSPRGKNLITQGKDLTQYEEMTPQLDTRAEQPQLRQTLGGCGGSQVTQFGGGCGSSPASHLVALLAEHPWADGVAQTHSSASAACGLLCMGEMNSLPCRELRELSDAPPPPGEPLLR